MAGRKTDEHAQSVREMFARIAWRYDLMNRIMTAGQDVRWRREVIRRAALPPDSALLDLGAGTGDLAREALRQCRGCRALAADFTLEMMEVGRTQRARNALGAGSLDWIAADAQELPLPEGTFDAVVSGFLLRNVSDVLKCLQEQWRVLKPGGRVVALDTSPPPDSILAPLIRFHLHSVIPTLGRYISGQGEAYKYLPDSTEGFLTPEQLARRMLQAGFGEVGFRRMAFGTVSIHWGRKPHLQRKSR